MLISFIAVINITLPEGCTVSLVSETEVLRVALTASIKYSKKNNAIICALPYI